MQVSMEIKTVKEIHGLLWNLMFIIMFTCIIKQSILFKQPDICKCLSISKTEMQPRHCH